MIFDIFVIFCSTVVEVLSEAWKVISAGIKATWDFLVKFFSTILDNIIGAFKAFGKTLADFFVSLWDGITSLIKSTWDGVTNFFSSTTTAIKNIWDVFSRTLALLLSDLWEEIKDTAANSWDRFTSWIGRVADGIAGIFGNLRKSVRAVFDGMWQDIKGVLNTIIGGVNKMTGALSSISISIPAVDIPGVGSVGGTTVGLPQIPRIPALERGGIVRKHTLVRMGEKDRKEAVVPLENPEYMRPFSQAVANDLAALIGGGGGSQEDRLPIMYVQNLIADERGLRELERRL